MSYARFGEGSDVYVFADFNGRLECCGCSLTDGFGAFTATTTDDMLTHLNEHAAAGHMVPARCLRRLTVERDENDKWLAEENG